MSSPPTSIDFREVEAWPEYTALKKKHRSLVLPLSVFFFLWYFAYVLLGAYAHDFMATPVLGNINLGIVLGLGQFVTTFVITMVYVRYANRDIDPAANDIRLELEKRAAGAPAPGSDPGSEGRTASGAHTADPEDQR